MVKKVFIGISGILLGVFITSIVYAAVPQAPSVVKVQGNTLQVQKRLPDGSLGAAAPYTIQGVTWSPGTKAPFR